MSDDYGRAEALRATLVEIYWEAMNRISDCDRPLNLRDVPTEVERHVGNIARAALQKDQTNG